MPEVTIDTTELNRFWVEARKFEPKLITRLRKSIRSIGEGATENVKRTVRLPSPEGGRSGGRGARERAAFNTRMQLSFAKSAGGVKIRTAGTGADGFVASYNQGSFRHKVFGQDVWVQQEGRPYFGVAIAEVWNKRVEKEMGDALQGAIDELVRATP